MINARYEKLLVWQRADELAYQVYMASKSFPREELYAMTSQVRRAALSDLPYGWWAREPLTAGPPVP